MAEPAGIRWTVRGVPQELREAAERAAGGKHHLGEWLSKAIQAHLERPEATEAGNGSSAILERLERLERRVEEIAIIRPSAVAKVPERAKEAPKAEDGRIALPTEYDPAWLNAKGNRLTEQGKALRDTLLKAGYDFDEVGKVFRLNGESIRRRKKEMEEQGLL